MDRPLTEPPAAGAPPAGGRRGPSPAWPHVLPFVAWIFIMQMLGDPAGWKYAVRSALCLGLFLYLRPWRWYGPLRLRHLPLALGVGVLVFVVWIGPETALAARWPRMQDLYLRFAILPFGRPPAALERLPYAPETCGWPLTLVRILGSGLVISFIEEFFWRGFLYRWLIREAFLGVDLGRYDRWMFPAVALLFGFEHDRWLVGIVAGVAYGLLILRTRDVWAAGVAHAVTNLLLGVYVVAAGRYGFWG